MLIILDHRSGIPIFKQVFDHIRYQILADRLKEGDQLMPVRELALALKINPMTISKSYSMLEREGFVDRKRGIGLFVRRPAQKDKAKIEIAQELLGSVARQLIELDVSQESASEVLRQLMSEAEKQRQKRKR